MKKILVLVLAMLMIVGAAAGFAEESKGLIMVITPSHANPYFKTVADDAVAARGRAHELTALVGEVDGQAVELVFNDIFHRFPGQLVRARRPLPQRRFALGLVKAPQPRQMRMLRKTFQRLRAHAAGGRVW